MLRYKYFRKLFIFSEHMQKRFKYIVLKKKFILADSF